MAPDGNIAVKVTGTKELVDEELAAKNAVSDEERAVRELSLDDLSAHIMSTFQNNRDAKRNAGVEAKIFEALRAYNGKYSGAELALIKQEGGADIYMNITATKCRTAKSWITDILTPSNEKAWMLSPTPMPELPEEMARQIEDALAAEFKEANKPKEEATPPGAPGQPTKAVPPAGPKAGVAQSAQKKIGELNRDRRELQEAAMEEIDNEAKWQVKVQERQIHDQLSEGKWDKALDEFIQDFVVFPTAFMKGPVVCMKPKLTWKDGEAVASSVVRYMNKRVSPLDMYPSPDATDIQDGNLIEHIRMSRMEIQNLRGVDGYDDDLINKVLGENQTGHYWMDDGIEDEKNDHELRGDEHQVNKDVIHGLHFFGSVKAGMLRSWGMSDLGDALDDDVVEVEAILAGDEVIKVQRNQDPLGRRPYYKASYTNIPGALWGRSLPEMMSPTQRMCNATARALATNLGMASGPQVEVYVDRIADNGDIDSIYPRKIWQVKSDSGNQSGRAVTFFNVPSNAKELLEVYREFEARADDVTGVPRYAYGSDPKAVGASTTATGLSMMLESATKIVKDAVRSIDNGLIKPRIEMQFYQNLVAQSKENNGNGIKYTGDIHVIAKGSAALTVKAAQNIRRNEFLSVTSNQTDQEMMGAEARMSLIREIGKELGLDTNIVPSAFKTRQLIEAKEKAAKENQKPDHGLEVAKMQTESAERVQQLNLQMKDAHKQMEMQLEQAKMQMQEQVKAAELNAQMQKQQQDMMARMEEIQAGIEKQNQEIALKLSTGKPGI